MGRLVCILAAIIGLSACSSETALFIRVESGLRVPEELNGLRFQVALDNGGKTLLDRTFAIPTQDDMPATLTVIGDPDKEVAVVVTVTGLKGSDEVARGTADAAFKRDKTVDVVVALGAVGPGDRDGGTDAATDVGHDAGVAADASDDGPDDAGPDDAGLSDSGTDAGPTDAMADAAADASPDASPDASIDASSDGGEPDAGPDAGFDAGEPDAGDADAGVSDTGTADAGFDAGCTVIDKPTACASKCGEVGDGCHATYACGDCSDGFSCVSNACACVSNKLCSGGVCCPNAGDACHNDLCCAPQCAGKCGGVSDLCGGQCTACPQSHQCEATACVHCGDRGEECCDASACNGANACKDGVCVPTDCTGLADFTTCDLKTDPDRRYDICVAGACVSPGCGDATCNTPGPHFPIPDTGQRKCYNDTAEIACPTGSGSPCNIDGSPAYCGQDAQYGWDVTHQQQERYTVSTAVADEPVVTDIITGMQWQGCAAGLKGADCLTGTGDTKSWDDGLAYCDSMNWGGQTGWRLPDVYEMQTIIYYGSKDPAINVVIFPATPSAPFWTLSVFMGVVGYPWYFRFDGGFTSADDRTASKHVRCVRGLPSTYPDRFFRREPVKDQPVVIDNLTGLVWQGCVVWMSGSNCENGLDQTKTWAGALDHCESLDWGGYTDWRLPNSTEAFSIVDSTRSKPAMDLSVFPSTPGVNSVYYWTSTPSTMTMGYAWCLHSASGLFAPNTTASELNLRCVRTGP